MATDTPAELLGPLVEALQADGYRLVVDTTDARTLRLEVQATDETCADCLVPEQLFADIATRRLADGGAGGWSVEVVYPDGARSGGLGGG
jgi:hypothetical protein